MIASEFFRRHAGATLVALVAPAMAAGQNLGADTPTMPGNASVVSREADGTPTIRAFPLTTPLRIDGALDESIYGAVEPAGDLVQQDPSPGAPATEKTDVWIFFDDKTVYVSARLWNSHPERELVHDSRRDANRFRGTGDSFSVALDTFFDRRNGYQFGVTPLGGMYDGVSTNERDVNRDWNGIWTVKTSRFDGGWSMEMAIPFKTLRYASGGEQVWGINVCRVVAWKNEVAYFTAIPPSLGPGTGFLKFSSAATLVGLTLPSASRVFEVKPYAISSVSTDRTVRPAVSNHLDGDVGIDVKYGVTRGLTADLTYNTDFAQVEEDEQQVNLTRFSLFFPEKREFFLEGQGIFSFGGYGNRTSAPPGDVPVPFFSRRIGLNDGRVVPIRAGARLTGKAGQYSLGLVNIETADEPVSGARATNFSAFRIKRDILRRSHVGALFTRRSRSAIADGSNEVYAVDGVFSFFENVNVNSYFARTRTPGFSGDDTSYRAQLDYNADRYGLQLERLTVDKHFNPEVGYARRRDFRRNYALFRFSPRPASIQAVKQFAWEGSFDHVTNGAGRLETREVQGMFRTDFGVGDRLAVQLTHTYEDIPEPFHLFGRVTVPVAAYSFRTYHAQYDIGPRRRISGSLAYDQGGFYGGDKKTVAYSTSRVQVFRSLSFEPSFSFNWIDLPQGSFLARVVATRGTYSLSPRMFVSGLAQYNSDTHSLGVSARVRWEYQPGSELFVVFVDGRNTLLGGFPQLESRSFIVKVTRAFRL